jgi:hypothetical protein
VTDEARISYSRRRQHSFAWAIDPDWSRSGADEDGCNGQLKISATQIYFRFYEFMSTKKLTLKDIWRDFHQVNITQTFMPGPLPAWHFTNLGKPVWPDSGIFFGILFPFFLGLHPVTCSFFFFLLFLFFIFLLGPLVPVPCRKGLHGLVCFEIE